MSYRLAWSILALILLAIVTSVGIALPSGDPDVIRVVSSLPRTGSARSQTDTIVNGIRMAFEEAGWLAGDFRIEYSDWDDATASAGNWDAQMEIANARRAVRDPNVMAYIGPFNSGAAKLSMPILNRAHLLMISPANTWPGLTKPGQGDQGEPDMYRPTGQINFFRTIAADDLQAPLAAEWAKDLGANRVFVLDDNEVYGKGVATLFVDACRQLGVNILGHESIDVKSQEYIALMTRIKSLNPDLVYFGGTAQSHAGQLVKDMRSVGLECPLMVPDACKEDEFINASLPENLNDNCYVTFGGPPLEQYTGAGKAFLDNYRKKFSKDPEAYAIYGYEAANAVLEAIRRAGVKDRAAIVAACQGIQNFEGALGRWSFDANGDTTLRRMAGYRVHNGKFEFLKFLGDE